MMMLAAIHDNFSLTLQKWIDDLRMDPVEVYQRARVSRQTWHKIISDQNYKPSKKTVICFALALKLSYYHAQMLLETAGYTLSGSSRFDITIHYFLKKGIYDIQIINEQLYDLGEELLTN